MYDAAKKSDLKAALDAFGLRANKKLGQNFLCDSSMADAIVRAAGALGGKHVLEIGPGAGALTARLCTEAASVCAIEIDGGMFRLLQDRLAFDNLTLFHADALKIDFAQLPHQPDCVVANLPYYITTALINRFLADLPSAQQLTLMIQREVAERLCAQPGTKAYGSLTLAVQYACDVQTLLSIPPECFYPAPDVSSSLVGFTRRAYAVQPRDEKLMFALIRQGFAMRRKTLSNNLTAGIWNKEQVAAAMQQTGLEPKTRAEALTLDQFIALSDAISETQ